MFRSAPKKKSKNKEPVSEASEIPLKEATISGSAEDSVQTALLQVTDDMEKPQEPKLSEPDNHVLEEIIAEDDPTMKQRLKPGKGADKDDDWPLLDTTVSYVV